MARTAVAYSSLVGNSSLADPAGTTADPTNGHTIAASEPERTLLRIKNTDTGAHNVTIKAGTYPPALASVQGDLIVSCPASSTIWLGPFESGRFIQKDGSLNVDLAAGTAGTVTAFLVPRSV
jgi:hypothetical protein